MNRRYQRFALAWFVSACVGCTSAPIRYYTLTPPPNPTLPGFGDNPRDRRASGAYPAATQSLCVDGARRASGDDVARQ